MIGSVGLTAVSFPFEFHSYNLRSTQLLSSIIPFFSTTIRPMVHGAVYLYPKCPAFDCLKTAQTSGPSWSYNKLFRLRSMSVANRSPYYDDTLHTPVFKMLNH